MSGNKRRQDSRGSDKPVIIAPAAAADQAVARASVKRMLLWLIATLTLMGLVGAGLWWRQATGAAPSSPSHATGILPSGRAAYVENKACLGCHQAQGEDWKRSHHAQAMASPTIETVRGDFDNTEFRHQGVTSRFFKRGEQFFVRTEGADGKQADFEIKYTFGLEPLQQYLIELPGGRLQPLQIAWDVPRQRWFHLQPNEKAPPGDVLHWTGRYQTANTMCIACHTTGFEKRYDDKTDTFASRWSEPNVSCQSCHGPGERHVQWARLHREGKLAETAPDQRYGLMTNFKVADSRKQVEVCAACHSRRSELDAQAQSGQPLLNHYLPSLLRDGLYHADGQQLDEVYVDGSFRQSKMYQKGVSCTNCHSAHTGRLKLAGNAVCLQCHAPQANPSFPSAAGQYDSPAHHFHKAGSPGAQCVSCHMPSKAYMQIQLRPDHSLRIPRPDLTVSIGTPNACTSCHADKPAQWAADRVAQWYGSKRRQTPFPSHYGETLAAARAGQADAHVGLAKLVADLQSPAIVRATALAELEAYGAMGASERIAATRDADPEVRAAAAESLDGLPAELSVSALVHLLSDPIRAVRIAAARSLLTLPAEQISASVRPAFDAALAEYIATQNMSLDMPGAQLNLAVVYQQTGRLDLSEQHYLNALKIDPDFTPARANLAQLYSATARPADAERVLVAGLKRMPGIGELQYSLGLLLAEQRRLPEAVQALTRAARLLPQQARVYYNLGLALQQTGQRKQAEAALLTAQQLAPQDPTPPYALAVFYAQEGQAGRALQWAQKLQAMNPESAQASQLIARLTGSQR